MILIVIAFIYSSVDFNVILSYLVNISLYDLAKIGLVGNLFSLLYFVSSFIIYINYYNLLQKGNKVEEIQISFF
jgi:hypothetical protein